MAERFEGDVGRTLRMTVHAPMPAGPPHKIPFGIFYPAIEGAAPAYATGNLARSMIRTPAYGGITATAMVGNTAVYAAVQEEGATLYPNSAYLHWVNTQGSYFMRSVTVPAHPYFARTLRFDIANGSLSAAAAAGFAKHMTLLS
jgi:phage gpG-like protein